MYDKLPIAAFRFLVTSEQKKLIADSVANHPEISGSLDLSISQEVPEFVPLQEFPGEIAGKIPRAEQFRYVKTADRVLIVDRLNRIVVGEIPL